MEDSTGGATKIKMPGTANINYNYFKRYISDEWYFKKNVTPDHGVKTKIINDVLNTGLERHYAPLLASTVNGADYYGMGYPKTDLGPINPPPGVTDFDVTVPAGIDMDYVRQVFLTPTDTSNISGMGISLPVGIWQTPMESYRIDKAARKIKFHYPIEWAKGVFQQGPVSGKWRRKLSRGELGGTNISVTPMVPNKKIPLSMPQTQPLGEGGHSWPTQQSVPVLSGSDQVFVNGEQWTRVSDLSTTVLSDAGYTTPASRAAAKVYEIDNSTGEVTFGDNTLGLIPPDSSATLTAKISAVWIHEESSFNIKLGETVEVIKLDLSEITAENCPRDPSDPDNPNKYGIIFSEMPMVVYGIPKVPVTIVCMEDLYVGPINSPYLKNTYPSDGTNIYKAGDVSDVSTNYPQDSKYVCPVGLMSAKVTYLDMTYAPITTAGKKVWANSFCESGTRKTITLNKVALFHSVVRDYIRGSEFYGPWSPFYGNQMGMLSCNGLQSRGNGHREWNDAYLINDAFWKDYSDSYSPGANEIKLIGSVYNDVNYDLINWVNKDATGTSGRGGKKKVVTHWICSDSYGYDDELGARIYASSFRSWDRTNPTKSGPPPNMPKEIKVISVDFADDRAVGAFLTELENLINANQSYNDEYGKALSELQSSLYH